MKRIVMVVLLCAMVLGACGQKTPTWQEQYDLGVRYLSEGNYEEAIIAFTAAIEIDPKQPAAYVGRGDAYNSAAALSAEGFDELPKDAQNSYQNAIADYLKAIELDPDNEEVYVKAARIYILLGQADKAKLLLEQGYASTNSDNLKSILNSLSFNEYGSTIFTERSDYRDFEALTSDEQNLVTSVIGALIAQNKSILIQITGTTDSNFYTMYEDYKVQLHNNTGGVAVLAAEIRPENGMGYFCQIAVATDLSSFSVPDNTTYAEYFDYGYCPCENWQWNGTVHETDQRYWTYDGRPDQYMEDNITGELKNNLKIGEEKETGSIGDIVDGVYIEDIGDETIRVYENGNILTETYRDRDVYSNGEWGEWQELKITDRQDYVYSVQGGHSYNISTQYGLDKLWW